MGERRALGMLAVALGCEPRCREDIDKIYDVNPKKYFKLYEESAVSKTTSFDKYTVTTSEYIKKCFSIILEENEKSDSIILSRLIKKGYKPAHTYFTHNSNPFLESFTSWYKNKSGGLEKLSGIYLDYSYFVMFFLSHKTGKKLMETPLLEETKEHFYSIVASSNIDDSSNLDSDIHSYKGYQDLVDLTSHKGIIGEDVSIIFENIRLGEELPLVSSIIRTNPFADIDEIRNRIGKMPLSRITNITIIMLELFGVSADVLRDAKIDKEKITSIAKYVKTISNANSINERESEIIFLVSLVLYSLATEYKNLRDVHYKNAKTTIMKNELEQEKQNSEKYKKLELEVTKLNNQISSSTERIAKVANETQAKSKIIDSMQLENKRLTLELKKAKENDKELQFLRNFYFDEINNKDEMLFLEDSVDTITEKLKTLKGVIVGGHPKFQIKMKDYLPNFTFLNTGDLGRNFSFLKNVDIVFFNSVYNNHGLFYKVMSELNASDVPLSYLGKTQSIEIILKEIYDKSIKVGILTEVKI
jgi:hypothetical protein